DCAISRNDVTCTQSRKLENQGWSRFFGTGGNQMHSRSASRRRKANSVDSPGTMQSGAQQPQTRGAIIFGTRRQKMIDISDCDPSVRRELNCLKAAYSRRSR